MEVNPSVEADDGVYEPSLVTPPRLRIIPCSIQHIPGSCLLLYVYQVVGSCLVSGWLTACLGELLAIISPPLDVKIFYFMHYS